jgi:bla regulator protein BlaR1
MPALFIFLLKVNIALLIFCLGYYLVLRKLTFYTLNRVYLVMAIVFSSVYPLIDLNSFMLRHQDIAAPVQQVAINWNAPQQLIQQPGYWQWATIIFWLGATVFAARLLVQFISLYKLYRNSSPATIQDHQVRVTKANISPFSFWQNIYLNPDNIAGSDLKSILQHEQVHIEEWHTLDILLAEISTIFYWFNPGVWLMKKAIRENIEFITDRKILQRGTDSKAYQYSLLNVSIAALTSAGISNHFNFSTLKKRIKMMNAKRSSNLNLTRYAVLVPMVIVLLMVFSFSKAELIKRNRNQLTHLITATIADNFDTTGKTKTTKRTSKPVKIRSTKATKVKTDDIHYVAVSGIKLPIGVPSESFLREIGNGDTTVKNVFIYKGDNQDTVSYTIDGKKVDRAEFLKSAPKNFDKDIESSAAAGGQMSSTWVNGKTQVVVKEPLNISFRKVGDSVITVVNSNFTYRTDQPTEAVRKADIAQSTAIANRFTVIDGKVATDREIKKLSVADVESINVKNGKEMTGRYGDKAKNGVIFITTKKSK